jgi:hypothetical protein
MNRDAALRLAIRCARDSMPPLRLAVIDDVARYPDASTRDVRQRLEKPRNTVDRQLQALHILGVLTCDEVPSERGTIWRYRLADGISAESLLVPDLSVPTHKPTRETLREASDISGTPKPDEAEMGW